ncbi:hypothetical protein [Sinanaerobacter sp. ZZT-01]|uniref:hypothetical protein n=1 Tax=Sinanaerobacter sp. ZZT-01 TaxID=3111540 RepID=UPI002D78C558|nr:hypothetical protein [Sinanaerobacter sp. ZZT-01]WRR93386.1 hypothetical protein U5921_15355 [Sinanaerobacter sp. ZZT-01]
MKRIYMITMVAVGMMVGMTVTAYAAKDVFSAGEAAINDFKVFFIAISTAALAVALGIAHLMKTFSGGNVQKIEFANKLTSGSIIGWTLVNGVGLIANTIAKYLN